MANMLENYLSTEAIAGYSLVATTGDAGVLEDVLFDDRDGGVRYFVFRMSRWLPSDLLLLDPEEMGTIDHDARQFSVPMTVEELEARPPISTDPPVSRQKEAEVGPAMAHGYWSLLVTGDSSPDTDNDGNGSNSNPHLRSAREIKGYVLESREGETGRIADLLFDQSGWCVKYLVVDVGVLMDKYQVLLGMDDVEAINWAKRSVSTSLLKSRIENGPAFDRDGQTASEKPREVYDQFVALFEKKGAD